MIGRKRGYVLATTALGAMAALALAAAIGSAQPAPDAAEAAAPDLTYVKRQVAKYSAVPKFTLKAPAFNARAARGKSIFNIAISSQIPFDKIIADEQGKVAKRFGIKYTDCINQGQPTQWVQCFNRAISQKADLILMEGLDPTYLQPQIKAARKAGIKTLATFALDPAMPKSLAPNVTSYVLDPFTPAARLMADWAIHDMKGRTNALVITSNEFRPSAYMVRAIQNEFRTRCATCKVKVVNIPIPDWATKMQSAVQSELLKDRGINYIIPLFDSMSQFVAPAITASGGNGKIFISTFNGTPFALKMIQDGDIVRQNVGQSMKWLASSNIDAAMRLLLGLKPVVDQQTPLRMFTKSNVNQAGKPPTNHGGYGNAYVRGYNRLWRAG